MKTPPGYEITEHTADIGIKTRAGSLSGLYENAARGMFSLLAEPGAVKPARKLKVSAGGNDPESLMVNWLNKLLYLSSVKKMLFSGFRIVSFKKAAGRFAISAEIRGDKYGPPGAEPAREIKAATYHALKVRKTPSGYAANIIFDV
jgi:SHS2 domain-containing protein